MTNGFFETPSLVELCQQLRLQPGDLVGDRLAVVRDVGRPHVPPWREHEVVLRDLVRGRRLREPDTSAYTTSGSRERHEW